jgi:hypothetical protein
MMESKELVTRVEKGMTFDQMKERAALLVKSGFLPNSVNTPEKALTIMMTGAELGLGFMESLRSINVIGQKPTMSAQLLLALCYRTKEVESAHIKESTDSRCVFVLKRKGHPEHVQTFTIEDAKKMGLSGKDNWIKQAKTMLEWRAISAACRKVFPDAVCGLYTPEEIADNVDVQETEGTVEVKEIHSEAEVTKKVDTEKATEALPSTDGAAGLDNPMEVDKLGNYYPLPPYDGFGQKCIMEIYHEKTAAGKPKGALYLEMIAKHSKNAEERALVGKFLELMKGEQ